MSSWKTPFELVLDGRSPTQLATEARAKSAGWFSVGLRVRVRGDRLRARYNELSRYSVAPLLKAKLVPTATGLVVRGHIYWTVLLGARLISALAALGFAVACAVFAARADWWAIWWGVTSAVFVFVAVTYSDSQNRSFEEGRLRRDLEQL